MKLKLLVSPLSRGAYFADRLEVARREYLVHYPGAELQVEEQATLTFMDVEASAKELQQLSRLSFVQGIFEVVDDKLVVVDQEPGFLLPEELVSAGKYQGKTNELVTQLAINVGLAFADIDGDEVVELLDPMAGRGTTLLWALRYAMNARGIEQDRKALDALHQQVKKQTKLHRIKHQHSQGYVGKRNRHELGRFEEFRFGERILRLTTGDSSEAERWAQHKRFHLLVSDLPYGVQHVSAAGTRNPLQSVTECAPAWTSCLRKGGAMVLVFNSYQPKRGELAELFTGQGLELQDFSAPHRMSESISRDLIVFKKV